MNRDTGPFLVALGVIIVAVTIIGWLVMLQPKSPPATEYAVVKVCKAPFLRQHAGEAVVKDEAGALYYRDRSGKLTKVDSDAKMKDLCP